MLVFHLCSLAPLLFDTSVIWHLCYLSPLLFGGGDDEPYWKMQHRKNIPSRCQVVSLTFIATEWFFKLKKIEVFFNNTGQLGKSNR